MAKLQREFGEKNFQVLAFPSNQFGRQEPKGNGEILKFAESKGIDTVFAKADVNGENTQPVYRWLKKATNTEDVNITWNFGTYWLVNGTGTAERFDIATVNSMLPSFLQSKLKRGSINSPNDLEGEIRTLIEKGNQ